VTRRDRRIEVEREPASERAMLPANSAVPEGAARRDGPAWAGRALRYRDRRSVAPSAHERPAQHVGDSAQHGARGVVVVRTDAVARLTACRGARRRP
jgi:hypothetical protein